MLFLFLKRLNHCGNLEPRISEIYKGIKVIEQPVAPLLLVKK